MFSHLSGFALLKQLAHMIFENPLRRVEPSNVEFVSGAEFTEVIDARH
jgi:hypothetical protein